MSARGLVLAIDQGTTNTKALLVDVGGCVSHRASVRNEVQYPRPGWAEQSADELWGGVERAIAQVVAAAGGAGGIDAIAISNQRESVLVWEAATGRPIGPCITWQCRRSAPLCERLRAGGHADFIEGRTGLAVDPLFPAAKIAWLLDNVEGARTRAKRGELRAGTVDTWLLWKLTGGSVHASDHSNASRTQLFDTKALCWDEDLARLFDVPLVLLPQVMPSNAMFGRLAASVSSLPAGIPVHAMVGDSHAALYGHGAREAGIAKATYGTGTSLMTLTGGRVLSRRGISSTIAWSTQAGVTYALEGNISVSGQAAAFMAELIGVSDAQALSRLAQTASDSNGVTFVPALVGLGAPHWRAEARGVVSGLSLGTKPAHLARAAIEAIAFQVADVLFAMEADSGVALGGLRADGGASGDPFLMQFQADIVGRPVIVPAQAEVSALGVAALAFGGLGREAAGVSAEASYEPAMARAERDRHLSRWHEAIARMLAETGEQVGALPALQVHQGRRR